MQAMLVLTEPVCAGGGTALPLPGDGGRLLHAPGPVHVVGGHALVGGCADADGLPA